MLKKCKTCEKELPATLQYFYKDKKWLTTNCKKCEILRRNKYPFSKKKVKKIKTEKPCKMCKKVFPLTTEYFLKSGKYFQSYCKKCSRIKMKEIYSRKKIEKSIEIIEV